MSNMDAKLPDGVVRARLGSIVEERKATAQVILDLEKLVVDERNRTIRVRNILEESRTLVRPAMLAAINRALKETE